MGKKLSKTRKKTRTTNSTVHNRHAKDSGAKLIFDDPILCAEFLRGYTNVELLKDVQPEDIEDISERFVSMWQEERDSDSVKKIHLKDTSLYLITIIEHQSRVHYDMSFRMLRYIVMVLTDYEEEQEKLHKGITKTKDFKYPPIIPIVYYEGSENWTAVQNFKDRVHLSDVFGDYIPSFEYLVVPLQKYSNDDLIAKNDELSLIMLINKLKSSEEFKSLKEIPPDYLENLQKNTPEYLLNRINKIIAALLYRLNMSRDEVETFTDQITRREFTMLFDNFEAYDIQEVRKESWHKGNREGKREGKLSATLDNIFLLLEDFGSIPDDIKKVILEEQDLEKLKIWLKLAAKANSIEEFREKAGI